MENKSSTCHMTNEKRLIDATPDDCIRKVKRKTNFAKIIVSGTVEKPYYEIMWFDYMDRQYHIGYGSYNLNFVFQWLSECFEVEDAPTVDAVEVVHGRWIFKHNPITDPKKYFIRIVCSECNLHTGQTSNYCPCCGAKMDGGNEDG